ncbi:MAG: FAD-dependent oxidoreductase, partial [Shewanella sp.]
MSRTMSQTQQPVSITSETQSFDVILVGGGMVGAATAIGLAKQGLHIAVIESFAPEAYSPEQALDVRVSA